MTFPDFSAVEQYLNSLINYEHTFPLGGNRSFPKLEPSLEAAKRLGLPLELPGSIHIAGTKGKGSIVHFLEALLATQGSVLSFSSPHLESVKERVRWNGQPLDDAIWQRGFTELYARLNEEPAISLTYFETIWIFYLWCAKNLQADYHIVECGLGGTWDATNIISGAVAMISRIDYDHTEILGDTLPKIAVEKAGIVKDGATVIVGRQPESVLTVLERIIAEKSARGLFFERDFGWTADGEHHFNFVDQQQTIGGLSLGVTGLHQRDNAAAAICAARELAPTIRIDDVRNVLAELTIPGRQQIFSGHPNILLDVAHNPISFHVLADTLREEYRGIPVRMVVGMMKGKDAEAALSELRGLVDVVGCVTVNNPRSRTADELRQIAEQCGLKAISFSDITDGFKWLHEVDGCELGIVAGSFYLAGDYLTWRKHAGIA